MTDEIRQLLADIAYSASWPERRPSEELAATMRDWQRRARRILVNSPPSPADPSKAD